MRDSLKLLVKYFLRIILRIYYIFPIKSNNIFFMCNMGKGYSCNPKYIYESMIEDERFSKIKFIWCFKQPENVVVKSSNNLLIVNKKNYLKYFYYLLTSRVIIYNCGGFSYAPIRKKQFLIETWHGGGAFKNVGLTVNKKSKASKNGIKIASKDIKLFLSSCRAASDNLIRKSMGYEGLILDSGFPRNDMLIHKNEKLKQAVRKKLGIKDNEKIVLYAPTFKGLENKAVNIDTNYEVIDANMVKRALNNRFDCNWKFATRGHQYANELDIKGTDYDWSSYPDMQELLLISDILITDYSSSIWDFAFTGNVCFLFAPDYNNYKDNERGFLTPFDEWPGIPAYSNKELNELINEFEYENYKIKVNNYLNKYGSYENGNACSMVKDCILEEIKPNI